MPNQTIDLSRDLEAWYDFDTDYFDSQRGQIQDRSGHGRHAEASGGPTVGVEGPDSFEAASFDGSDDEFVPASRVRPSNDGDPFCVFFLSRANDTGSSEFLAGTVNNNSTGFQIRHDRKRGEIRGAVADTSGLLCRTIFRIDPTQYVAHTLNIDGTDGFSYTVNGETKRQEFSSGEEYQVGPVDFKIGVRTINDAYFSGDIAVAGVWSRALSDAEIEYLNRLTAPRRSQL